MQLSWLSDKPEDVVVVAVVYFPELEKVPPFCPDGDWFVEGVDVDPMRDGGGE